MRRTYITERTNINLIVILSSQYLYQIQGKSWFIVCNNIQFVSVQSYFNIYYPYSFFYMVYCVNNWSKLTQACKHAQALPDTNKYILWTQLLIKAEISHMVLTLLAPLCYNILQEYSNKVLTQQQSTLSSKLHNTNDAILLYHIMNYDGHHYHSKSKILICKTYTPELPTCMGELVDLRQGTHVEA